MDINYQRIETMANNPMVANQMLEMIYGLGCHYQRNYHDDVENATARERAERILSILIKNLRRTVTLEQVAEFPVLNFAFACEGINALPYLIKKSAFFRKLCPALSDQLVTAQLPKAENRTIRVGFISQFLSYYHSVFKDRHQIIHYLSQQPDFEVQVFTFREPEQTCLSAIPFIPVNVLSTELEKTSSIIASYHLDILVYCDIGMFDPVYFLAHRRLAPVQINTWGHSSSSGIDSIDYFISSRWYETEEAQRFYREKLVLCDSLSTCYVDPASLYRPSNPVNSGQFTFLPERGTLYMCLQSPYKLSPTFLQLIREILKEDDSAYVVFLNGDDIDKVMLTFKGFPHRSRVIVSPRLAHENYLNLMSLADVVLDSYPVGGCNSSLEAFSLNKVVVTWPTDLLNGRFTQGFYRKMNIIDPPIAHSASEYVDWALRLGKHPEERQRLSVCIQQSKNCLFSEHDSCTEWAALLRDFSRRSSSQAQLG